MVMGMVWQLPWVQTVYKSNITAIAISCSSSEYWIIVHVIPVVSFLPWKQLFAAGSTIEAEQRSLCRAPTLAQSSNHYWNGMGVSFNVWCNWILLLSCDNVLKFDWCYQLSGSRSTHSSLNSQKLPGCFSYSLGTRPGGPYTASCMVRVDHLSIPTVTLITSEQQHVAWPHTQALSCGWKGLVTLGLPSCLLPLRHHSRDFHWECPILGQLLCNF